MSSRRNRRVAESPSHSNGGGGSDNENSNNNNDNDTGLPNVDLYTYTPDVFPLFKRTIENHIDIKNNLDKMLNILTKASVELEEQELRDDLNVIEDQVKTILDNKEKLNYFNLHLRDYQTLARSDGNFGLEESIYDTDYIEYKTKVWKVHHPNQPLPQLGRRSRNNDDLVVEEIRESLKCPITTNYYEDPVVSSQCKHSFSRKAIEECIRSGRGSFTCPVSGCDKIIRQSYLKPNDDLKKKVEEHLTEQQTQAEEQVNFTCCWIVE
ncbi:hypothetical protein CONCODRAFT_16126 [Conidiobolus coronatus NRRL 28638]|uniref:SP-RING-type domain-containing protein n=1 Tax=Conidiobolus coronatus (strain ATCC 28846 / CBS 209.66 / NRRL 28638) TaxID=796925 RepID=A0A137PBV6_CONC2|nr:hypothetical protein CONCODRAFT_16126 [Conidiobolus coronatus NRRL 28638]|eukprot:KXN72480.1 hypothetical protein CONCODRAFT_16126 [Conidiobolus coronatus NRRL 28638]